MHSRTLALVFASFAVTACKTHIDSAPPGERAYLLERVDDVAIVQVYADGFERLEPRERALCWHLYQAAVAGRTIYMQQRCAEALDILALGEELLTHSAGIERATLEEVRRYMKLFWVNHSPYNNITARKNLLRCTPSALVDAAERAQHNGAQLPLHIDETPRALVARLAPMLFDPEHKPMVTAKNPVGALDIVQASAATFYGPGVNLRRLEQLSERYELNSNVVLDAQGQLAELPWRAGSPAEGIAPGLYARELEGVIAHLEAALPLATEAMRKALEAQIRFYRTGERADREAYDIAWVADTASPVDTVNSFVEVYVDPRGKKGAWEGIVDYEDPVKATLIKTIADNAQWFEDHMPYAPEFRKPQVRGISARSIDVIVETGDAGPVSAIGINLPNDARVRELHGSKSVSLANIVEASERATPAGARREFCWDDAEAQRAERWQALTSDMLTNMHEVIGHASGRQAQGFAGEPADSIGENYSALEEARADLVALYFMADPKLAELGLLSDPQAAALAAYEHYVRNGGLQQLRRVRHGDQLEEDHMRNRQLVVHWIEAHAPAALERARRDDKTFLRVRDVAAFRAACGELLGLVQRIKSTGDGAAAKELLERYGVKFEAALRDEVVARYERYDVPSYIGYVFPRLEPITDASGRVVDARLGYPASLEAQMLEWSGRLTP